MTLVRMFEQVGLYMDLVKTNYMTCTPVLILGEIGKEAYKWRVTGVGANFLERKWTQVSCGKCGITIAAPSLQQNVASIHRGGGVHKR